MKKFLKTISILLLLVVTSYIIWSLCARVTTTKDIFPRYVLSEVENFGKNTGKGNVLALSPYLHTYDFSSQEAYYNMFDYYLSFAQRKKLLNDTTVLILPENIGTWLVALNEKKIVYKDTSVAEAIKSIMLSNLIGYGKAYLFSQGADTRANTVFRMKASSMAEVYQQTFSKLSKKYKITIVAGSIILPDPSIKKRKITLHYTGKLYNTTMVFDKAGNVLPQITKNKILNAKTNQFATPAMLADIPIYNTPAGKLGILIGADAWYPENYRNLQKKQTELLIVPVCNNNNWYMGWQGYNPKNTPNDVDKNDISTITEQEAWLKYAMVGRASNTGIKNGVTVFLRGNLWYQQLEGNTLIWNKNTPAIAKPPVQQTGSLINVWL